jgi:hypothetical protein
MVLRGDKTSIALDAELVSQLKSEGWRWSAHTQPGLEARHAIASASDQNVLKVLGQEQSLILNSAVRGMCLNRLMCRSFSLNDRK